jgi:uncharacterized protein
VASGAAGLVCLPVAWLLGMNAHIGGVPVLGPGIVGGAILLAFGAVMNDACLLGSLWRLGNGELRLLALPVGLAAGFALAGRIPGGIAPRIVPSILTRPGWPGGIVVGVSGVILIVAFMVLRRRPRHHPDRWPLALAMAFLGVAGALLYLVQPGWSYADAVRREVVPTMPTMTMAMMTMAGWGGAIAALLTVIGAALSALRLGVFKPSLPTVTGVLRSLGGGVLMALGATMIPGGNDTLLLASVPAGSVPGAMAYTIMTAMVILLIAALKRLGWSTRYTAAG